MVEEEDVDDGRTLFVVNWVNIVFIVVIVVKAVEEEVLDVVDVLAESMQLKASLVLNLLTKKVIV